MKTILRFRWIFAALLLLALYLWDRRLVPSIELRGVLFILALVMYAELYTRLDRIESKLNAISTQEALGGRTTPVG